MLSIVIAVVLLYIRIFIYRDYWLVKEVECDPNNESCFIYTPEELCEESEDINCINTTEPEYYKIIHKKAFNVDECGFEDSETCSELLCGNSESESTCYYEYDEEES